MYIIHYDCLLDGTLGFHKGELFEKSTLSLRQQGKDGHAKILLHCKSRDSINSFQIRPLRKLLSNPDVDVYFHL